MEKKIADTFKGFPDVTHVFVSDTEVFFDERENTVKVTREEFNQPKKTIKNGKQDNNN